MNRGKLLGSFLAGSAVTAAVLAADGAGAERAVDILWIKAGIICLVHIFATPIRPILKPYAALINSFGGGMAVTYVLGHLLPELSEGHEKVGQLIYLLLLIGFVVYYALERQIRISRLEAKSLSGGSQLALVLIGYWLYNWLILFGLPAGPTESALHIMLITVAVGLHLLHSDYWLGTEYPTPWDRWGRYVVATAPVAGLLCRSYIWPEGELLQDVLTAILAGSVMFSVFKKELPNPENAHFGGFLSGIVTYTILLVLIRRLA